MVTHSLGSSVGLALQRNNPERDFHVVTYGAPVIGMLDPFRGDFKVERYKHVGRIGEPDPVASLDMFANVVPINSKNPLTLHSYKGYVYDWDSHNIKPSVSKPVIQPNYNIAGKITTQSNPPLDITYG